MTHEDRCPECKNTNGEHKQFCTRWTNEARALGLRQCDLDDMREGEVISRVAATYGYQPTDIMIHIPANHAEFSPVELARALIKGIEADEDSELFGKKKPPMTYPENFNLTNFDRFRAQRQLMQAREKFLKGDSITNKELDMLIDYYRLLEAATFVGGELYRLIHVDAAQRLETLEGFKRNRARK